MPLSGLGVVFGPLLLGAVGGNPADGAGAKAFGGIANALGAWMITNVQVLPGTMAASGASVTGKGKLTCTGNAADLGPKLAGAAGDPSALGVKTWTANATALIAAINDTGTVDPTGFTITSPSTGGTLGGTGKVSFTTKPPGNPTLAAAAGITDAAGVAAQNNFGNGLLGMIEGQASVLPGGLPIPLTAPPGGGPIAGTGVVV